MQVVWFKRDFRIEDHAPLAFATKQGTVLPLIIDEPDILFAQDQSFQHVQFREECISELRLALLKIGAVLHREYGDAIEVLNHIWSVLRFTHLWSHEETGNGLTYQRDLAVKAWCVAHQVEWIEYRQFGVVRRLPNRDGWSRQWDELMRVPCIPAVNKVSGVIIPSSNPLTMRAISSEFNQKDKALRQAGGRKEALKLITSFLEGRGANYSKGMSSPLSAEMVCSRLSPHIAFGTLSIREIICQLDEKKKELECNSPRIKPNGMRAAIRSFEGRLYWHCHFIQKLESQPSIEFQNMHAGFDGMREHAFDSSRYLAWCKGETGYPMIDASMRMLAQTGWINFRMRAMLASFSAYQLWMHWREPALHLAREFLDYEPGIHYAQIQMQSGVTGINTPRIYNPVKQARDQDPEGIFVKRWLPELRAVPNDWIFEPWLMPSSLQQRYGVVLDRHYPHPIVQHEIAAREAKQRLTLYRKSPDFISTAKKVLSRHGSRQSKGRTGVSKNPSQSIHTQGTFDFG